MKIGRYIAIINPPISAPNTDMMIGSINELNQFSLSTAFSLNSSFERIGYRDEQILAAADSALHFALGKPI